jgi:hypothetical protein
LTREKKKKKEEKNLRCHRYYTRNDSNNAWPI